MRTPLRALLLLALVALAAPLVVAPAFADMPYREFSGQVDKISSGAKAKLIVDNRQGDKVSFEKVDNTEVSGEGKSSWDDLKKGDFVTVYWKFTDKPRKAYKVEVKPAPADNATDE